MIARHAKKLLFAAMKRQPASVILGPRQVGKSTLARQYAAEVRGDYLFLDREIPSVRRRLEDPDQFLAMHRQQTVIIDEAQMMPEIFSVLRPEIDADRRNGRFLLTGSAQLSLVRGISESLAGRIAYVDMSPIGRLELPEEIAQYAHFFRGGYPNALLAESDEEAQLRLIEYVRSYMQQDMNALFGIGLNEVILSRLWRMIANSQGNIWNSENFSRALAVSAPTVMRYVEHLEGAFLIRRLLPWLVNANKRLVRSPKVYIRDSGVLHALTKIPNLDELFGHTLSGNSWEGYAIEQLCQVLPHGISPYFYRTHAGAEADLVLVKNESTPVLCAEIKLSNSARPSRGFHESCKDLGSPMAWCITPESDRYPMGNGVEAIGLAAAVAAVAGL